ncbi:MAG: acetoin utilization deacetylase AcuC-like enzyme [Verrucomicrobiales bacterium]|jgi:acetoin utilization deacetylase AcuC-like enzyme
MPDKKKPSPTGLLLDPVFTKHLTGAGHPERPERYTSITAGLEAAGLVKKLTAIEPRDLRDEEALLCHTSEYLTTIKTEIPAVDGIANLSTGDTSVCAESLDVARQAAGGALNAIDFIFGGAGRRNAFCAVRPPGHHATPSVGMGFCIFNNAAIAARYAQRKHGIERVAIVDWDVHHGNGTQDIFYEDGSVFYFSTHQSPLYPHTGAASETGVGKGANTTLNCPFPAGTGMQKIAAAFDHQFLPAMETFKPELVIISAGFDSRIDDPLGAFRLTDEDFATLTAKLMKLADDHADGRLLSVLEGGYNVDGLTKAVVSHVSALAAM